MADEPRRSGRATKGQHTKNETPEPSQKKGKGRKKSLKEDPEPEPEPDEEEEAIIRCVCGYVVEDPRDKRAMICCDQCMAWQHNVHMGLSTDDDDLPDQYFCEQCKPEDHKELLDAIARGEKIWETREAEVKAAKTAGRKKGKAGRKSNAADKDTPSVTTEQPTASARKESVEAKQEAGTKRKLAADASTASPTTDNMPSKMRKVSSGKNQAARRPPPADAIESSRKDSQPSGTGFQASLVQNIEDLNEKARRGAATGLLKTFTDAANDATKSGTFTVPAGQDLPSFALKLALAVEYALYMQLWTRGADAQHGYGTQCRAIMHNVKQNSELRDKIFHNQVSPSVLSRMTSEDMQSQEMQQKNAEWRKENEKQSVISADVGTLIRRTHKGEEIIEKATGYDYDGAALPPPTRRPRETGGDDDQMDVDQAHEVELPAEIHRPKPSVDIRKLSIDTKRRTSSGQASGRKPSATFDVDKVWSSVESPGTPARQAPGHMNRRTSTNTKADPDIDRLLKDENEDDEEYSPADYTPDPDQIWAGSVLMPTVADIRATAKYAAGANLSSVYPWDQLMSNRIDIEGRLDIDKAEAYLCGLQYSKTKDVTVVSLHPADHQEDKDGFNKLFEYFTNRKRYGVVKKCPLKHARDIYVIPLEAGSGNLPSFLELLEQSVLAQERKSRMLLVAYVINCTTEPEGGAQAATSQAATTNQTAHAANQGQQRTSSMSQHMSPVAPTPSQHSPYANIPPNPYAQSPSMPQHYVPPSHPNPAYPPQYQIPQSNGGGGGSLTGMAAAIHILGDQANSRAIIQLLAQTPNIGVNEFGHIKDVFATDPNTKNSIELLLPQLQAKISGGH